MTRDESSQNLKGATLALASFAVYALHDVVIKYLGQSYSIFQIVFFIVLFGFPLTTLILMGEKRPETLRPKFPVLTILRSVLVVITGGAAFYAFSTLPLAQTYAILFAMPLVITLLSIPILGERVGPRRAAAVVVGLIGVLVVLRPGAASLEWGHLAAMLAAVTGSLVSVILRKTGNEERSVVLILYPMIANFLVMATILPFVYRPMPLIDMALMAAVAVLALIAMGLVIMAYRCARAVIVAPMQYSQIIWAVIYGALLFDESLDMPTVIGASIIIASGIYIVLREDSARADSTQPVLRTRGRMGTPSAPKLTDLIETDSA